MNSTNRLMGDAIHLNVATLAAVPGLQLAAGYVTGTPDIKWTPTDWAVFTVPGIFSVAIDQGGPGSPVPWAHVRDVEPGAWTPAAAVDRSSWTPQRPTIYCDRNDLPAVLANGWRGDLWLAIPGWQPGQPLPAAPGCTVVAVQNDFNHPAYDLSLVLDPYWPSEVPMPFPLLVPGFEVCVKCAAVFYAQPPAAGNASVCPAGGTHDGGNPGSSYTYVQQATGSN